MFSNVMKYIRRVMSFGITDSQPIHLEREGGSTVLRRSYDTTVGISAADQAVTAISELARQSGGIEQLRIELSIDAGEYGSLFAETIARRLMLSEDDQFRVTRHSGRNGRCELVVDRLKTQPRSPDRIEPMLAPIVTNLSTHEDRCEPSALRGFYQHLSAQLRGPMRKAVESLPGGKVLGIDEIVIVSEDDLEAAVRRVAAEHQHDLPLTSESVPGGWLAEKISGVAEAETLSMYPAFASVTLAANVRLRFERKVPMLKGRTPDSVDAVDDGMAALAPLPTKFHFTTRIQTSMHASLDKARNAVLLVPRHRIFLSPTGLACEPIESPLVLAYGESMMVGRGWDHAEEREPVLRSCAGKPLMILRTKKQGFPSKIQIEISSGKELTVAQVSENVPTQLRGVVLQPGQRGTVSLRDGDCLKFGRHAPYLEVQVRVEAVRVVESCSIEMSKSA